MKSLRLHLALLVVLGSFWCAPAAAQDVQRTVVLNVSGGGTELLTAEIDAIEVVELRDQGWFLKQVRSRGMRAKKLLTRPADLRFVMSGGNVAYVIHVDEEDGTYEGRIFGADGEIAKSIPLGTEFGQVEAAEVRAAFEEVLGVESDVVEPIEVTPEEVEDQAVSVADEQPVEQAEAQEPDKPGGLAVGAAMRLFKRDLTFTGANNGVLNYQSALYPGFRLAFGYVFGGVEIGPSLLGTWLDLSTGFDSVGDASVLHLDAALGVALHFDVVTLRVGGRHIRYTLSDEAVFPSLAHTVVLVGLGASQTIGSFVLGTDVEVYPWGTYGGAGDVFGDGSSEFGFAAHPRVGFRVARALELSIGYGARLGRSKFTGEGSLDFRDSRGFELVHGPEIGITWQP